MRDVLGGRMWMNRNALVVNGSGASRPDAFVNGTSAYVFEQGVESILVSESPQNGGDLFRYRIVDLEDPPLDRWELIGPGLRSTPTRAPAPTTRCAGCTCAPRRWARATGS